MISLCKRSAEFIVLSRRKKKDDHTFSCKTHLGLLIRSAVEQSSNGSATAKYVPPPGDQPCLFGITEAK